MINLKQNFIFCHNEKTAGTSMSMELRQLPDNYYVNSDLFEVIEQGERQVELQRFTWHTGIHYRNMHCRMRMYQCMMDLSKFWSFGFVRNPLQRYVSLYLQQIKDFTDVPEIPNPYRILEIPPEQFKLKIDERNSKFLNVPEGEYVFSFDFFMRTYIPGNGNTQTNQLCDENKKPLVDFVGRYENINHDWEIVCDKLNIPHRSLLKTNLTGGKISDDVVQKFFNKDLKEFVYDHYNDEFEVFGYEKR
jgi:hypothetical protein